MVNILRRFSQPLMVIFTILVIIAFSSWGPNTGNKSSRSAPATIINGRGVSMEEFQRAGRILGIHARLGHEFAQLVDPTSFMGKISQTGVENALLFEQEAAALGVSATVEEIQRQLTSSRIFLGPDRKYDDNRFQMIAQQVLIPEGFARTQIDQFLTTEIKAQKIAAMLASTIPPTPAEIKAEFIRSRLTTEASYVEIRSEDFRAAQKVTEDEIKQRYEAKKEFLKSPEMRKVRFAAFTLAAPADGKPLDEAKRTEEQQKLANDAYDFAIAMQKPGADFDKAAKEAGARLGETAEFFTRDTGPAELEASPAVAEAAFSLSKEKPYSGHITLGNGTYVLAYKETKAPEILPLDKVRKQLEDELISEKADAAKTAKAKELRAKLIEARKNAKSFAEAAQSLGAKAVAFPAFSMTMRLPQGTPLVEFVVPTAAKLAPGEISDVVQSGKSAIIVHVDQRPAVDEKGMEEASARIAQELQGERQMLAFQAWLADRREAAGLKPRKERE